MPTMLFPDPRFRSPTAEGGFGAFGLTYACDDVRNAQARLKSLLDQATAAKLLVTHWFTANEGHPVAVAAQDTYDNVVNQNLVIESDDACAQVTATLDTASDSMQGLLDSVGAQKNAYVPPAQSPYVSPPDDTLAKLKPLFIAGAVVVGAVVLAPILFEVAGLSRVFRSAKKRVSGRR
jgi:hypothetical protein